jgi:hypothetical protein
MVASRQQTIMGMIDNLSHEDIIRLCHGLLGFVVYPEYHELFIQAALNTPSPAHDDMQFASDWIDKVEDRL